MSFEWFLAWRYLRAKRKTRFISIITFISVAGVAVGVMALVVVLAVMNGFENEIHKRIIGINAHVIILKYGNQPITGYNALADTMEAMPEVVAAAPFTYTKAVLKGYGGSDGVVLRGIELEREARVTDILANINPPLSSLQSVPGEIPGAILGDELASRLRVTLGDTVAVSSPFDFVVTPMMLMPAVRQFKVRSLFSSGMFEYDQSLVYIDLKDAQSLFNLDDGVVGISVKTTDPYAAAEMGEKIVARLGGFPYRANNWIELNRNLFTWMKTEKKVMFWILSLIIMVAAFNIASTLIMVVMEKTRDIGIMKSMGAKPSSVLRIFVFEGLVIGALGTMVGSIAGYVLAAVLDKYQFITLPGDVYPIETLPVEMHGMDFVVVAVAAVLISFAAALYPAWQASRLAPVEAIRRE
ncbi:MAG: lipoprotein-releasing ABC transporter permease subunit [Candidatus Eisenbacteria bacterium]|nr:lipoprotein-releasing ABC transporter permease subunit [Candidatus Eisenbacteria bacterium]